MKKRHKKANNCLKNLKCLKIQKEQNTSFKIEFVVT